MNNGVALLTKTDYVKPMFRRTLTMLCSFGAAPAIAAEAGTGIVSTQPALTLFAVAAVMLTGLLLRKAAHRILQDLVNHLGEMRIRRVLSKQGGDVLHDFIIPGAYGGLARIDHAVLTAGGILCIRTVHCHGVVFGSENEAQWTHVDGITRRRFLNPLIQNEGRRRALSNIVPDVPVANLVIFTGSVEFTAAPPQNVIHVRDLENFIAKFVFGPSKIKDWDAVWLTVKAAALTDESSRKDHAAQLSFG